jgi:hypothetical protein
LINPNIYVEANSFIKELFNFVDGDFNLWCKMKNEGGLLFKVGGSNMQHVTSLSFLLLAYSNYLSHANGHVQCGTSSASPAQLKRVAKRQVIKSPKFQKPSLLLVFPVHWLSILSQPTAKVVLDHFYKIHIYLYTLLYILLARVFFNNKPRSANEINSENY